MSRDIAQRENRLRRPSCDGNMCYRIASLRSLPTHRSISQSDHDRDTGSWWRQDCAVDANVTKKPTSWKVLLHGDWVSLSTRTRQSL